MTDNDLDELLSRHGETWRSANADRPGIDWSQLPAPAPHRSRRWAAAGAVVAVAAVIAVAVAVLPSMGNGNVIGHPGAAPATALRGAPHSFVALKGKRIYVAQANQASGSAPLPHRITALAASNGSSGYFAVNRSTERATIYRLAPSGADGDLRYHVVTTVPGQISRTPMAVSPDGTKLAYSLTRRSGTAYARSHDLFSMGVLNLSTHGVEIFRDEGVPATGLSWASDSQHLVYSSSISCVDCSRSYLSREIDTAAGNCMSATCSAANSNSRVLSFRTDDLIRFVFFWHGVPVTITGGQMHQVHGEGVLGKVLATQFPTGKIVSVTGDPTGNHLLISVYAGTTEVYVGAGDNKPPVPDHVKHVYKTYRWDNGYLTQLDQNDALNYQQAGW